MSEPIALCIEDCDAVSDADKYVRCVAVPAGTPGLALAANGEMKWQSGDPAACALWVSEDDSLMLQRAAGAPPMTLQRAGRMLDVPSDKPVKVLDQDRIDIGPRHLRMHIHGRTDAVTAPAGLELPPDRIDPSRLSAEAAAVEQFELRKREMRERLKEIELRERMEEIELNDNPPRIVPVRSPSSNPSHPPTGTDRTESDMSEARKALEMLKIMVRDRPPSMEIIEPGPKKPLRPHDKSTERGGEGADAVTSAARENWSAMRPRFCDNCGNRLDVNSRFCDCCGAKIE